MSKVTFPIFSNQPGLRFESMQVTGASVSQSTAGSAGLDNRGKFFANILSDGAGTFTVTFLQGYADVPIVIPVPLTTNRAANITAVTTTGFTYQAATRDNNAVLDNNANFRFLIGTWQTTSAFS